MGDNSINNQVRIQVQTDVGLNVQGADVSPMSAQVGSADNAPNVQNNNNQSWGASIKEGISNFFSRMSVKFDTKMAEISDKLEAKGDSFKQTKLGSIGFKLSHIRSSADEKREARRERKEVFQQRENARLDRADKREVGGLPKTSLKSRTGGIQQLFKPDASPKSRAHVSVKLGQFLSDIKAEVQESNRPLAKVAKEHAMEAVKANTFQSNALVNTHDMRQLAASFRDEGRTEKAVLLEAIAKGIDDQRNLPETKARAQDEVSAVPDDYTTYLRQDDTARNLSEVMRLAGHKDIDKAMLGKAGELFSRADVQEFAEQCNSKYLDLSGNEPVDPMRSGDLKQGIDPVSKQDAEKMADFALELLEAMTEDSVLETVSDDVRQLYNEFADLIEDTRDQGLVDRYKKTFVLNSFFLRGGFPEAASHAKGYDRLDKPSLQGIMSLAMYGVNGIDNPSKIESQNVLDAYLDRLEAFQDCFDKVYNNIFGDRSNVNVQVVDSDAGSYISDNETLVADQVQSGVNVDAFGSDAGSVISSTESSYQDYNYDPEYLLVPASGQGIEPNADSVFDEQIASEVRNLSDEPISGLYGKDGQPLSSDQISQLKKSLV